jgi:preprotein translocase subunit SecY
MAASFRASARQAHREYIDYVLTRITVVGALYLAASASSRNHRRLYGVQQFAFGGTSC